MEPTFFAKNGELFYRVAILALQKKSVPFLLGGSYALCHHAQFTRETKDVDIFVERSALFDACEALAAAGLQIEHPFAHWLSKGFKGELFVDIIHNSGNGVARVDDEWFTHSQPGFALGLPIRICPVEETIWSKAYIMERERYDGADVAHLLRACAEHLDWERLLRRFGPHWRVLLSHLVLFGLIYPGEKDRIPKAVMGELLGRMNQDTSDNEETCGGTLISREQYLIDVHHWGYRDAREKGGVMSAHDIAVWTNAIA